MLRIISKQAQIFTTNTDSDLVQPVGRAQNFMRKRLQERQRGKHRGTFLGNCNFCSNPLEIGQGGRRICPTCNPPRQLRNPPNIT